MSWRRVLRVLLLLSLAGPAGCGGSDDPARAHREIQALVRGVVKAYGGEGALARVQGWRLEGTLNAARRREQAEVVRWVRRPDRLRVELRYADRGELLVVRGSSAWAGPDDLHLQPASGAFLESLRLQAARLDLPLRLAEQDSALRLLPRDREGRAVLQLALEGGMTLDYHIDRRRHRIERIEMRAPGPPPTRFAADLGEFRWVRGVLFPFREDTYAGSTRTAVTRFRIIELNPDIPPELMNPPATEAEEREGFPPAPAWESPTPPGFDQ